MLAYQYYRYFGYTKPTKCQLHFGLFPPRYVDSHKYYLIYTQFYSIGHTTFPPFFQTPNSILRINIMVQSTKREELYLDEFYRITRWMESAKLTYFFFARHEVYVILDLAVARNEKSYHYPTCSIQTMKVYQICSNCKTEDDKHYGTLITTNLQTFDRSAIIRNAFPSSTENVGWLIYDYSSSSTWL